MQLEKDGILTRRNSGILKNNSQSQPVMLISQSQNISMGGKHAAEFINEHISTFYEIERTEPGQWVLSQGQESLFLRGKHFEKSRGELVTLTRAIPLPSPHTPIDEVLEFKNRRADEIADLMFELDNFYAQIDRSTDQDFELSRLIRVIDKTCSNLINASRESKFSFHIGNLDISLSLNNVESAISRAALWEAKTLAITGLPFVGSALGGASSFVSISRGIGAKNLRGKKSPFRVAASMHKELIR